MLEIGDRVEIPAWSDWWMSGSRFGAVRSLMPGKDMAGESRGRAMVELDNGRMVKFYRDELRKVEVPLSEIVVNTDGASS